MESRQQLSGLNLKQSNIYHLAFNIYHRFLNIIQHLQPYAEELL